MANTVEIQQWGGDNDAGIYSSQRSREWEREKKGERERETKNPILHVKMFWIDSDSLVACSR